MKDHNLCSWLWNHNTAHFYVFLVQTKLPILTTPHIFIPQMILIISSTFVVFLYPSFDLNFGQIVILVVALNLFCFLLLFLLILNARMPRSWHGFLLHR